MSSLMGRSNQQLKPAQPSQGKSMSDLAANEIEEAIRLIELGDPIHHYPSTPAGVVAARNIIKRADSDDFKDRLCEELYALTETMEAHGYQL